MDTRKKVFLGIAAVAAVVLIAEAASAKPAAPKPSPNQQPVLPPIIPPIQQPVVQPVNPFEPAAIDLTPAEQALKDWVADPNAQNQVQKGGNIGEEEEAPFMTAGLDYASIFNAA